MAAVLVEVRAVVEGGERVPAVIEATARSGLMVRLHAGTQSDAAIESDLRVVSHTARLQCHMLACLFGELGYLVLLMEVEVLAGW